MTISGKLKEEINTAIEELKEYVRDSYKSTYEKIGPNIFRGHLRSLSAEIENGVALFISKLIPDCKIFLDPSIRMNKKNNRPDILVVNENDEVVAMIEIKSNMGWCRDAKLVIDGIVDNDEKFRNSTLCCEFSIDKHKKDVKYGDDVKLFLIVFTDDNCSNKYHDLNKKYADEMKVYQYSLFHGVYYELENSEIERFAYKLLDK